MSKKLVFLCVLLAAALTTSFTFFSTQQDLVNYSQGRKLFFKKQYTEAIPFFQKTLAFNPSHRLAAMSLGYAYLWTGNPDKAADFLKKASLLDPQNLKITIGLAEAYAWSGDYEKAIAIYEKLPHSDSNVDLVKKIAKVYIWNEQYDKAKEKLMPLVASKPTDAEVSVLWGQALDYSGDREEAVKVYQQILEDLNKSGQEKP